MRKAAVFTLLALILSNALVVANKAKSTGYENTVQHTVASVEAIQTESDTQVELERLLHAELPDDRAVAASKLFGTTQAPSATSEEANISKETIALAKAKASEKAKASPEANVSNEEIELLARIVSAEAKSEPYKGQVAVAAVVLNRMEKGFGDSIKEVVYSEGQFQPVSNGTINKKPVKSAYQAAKEALNGKDPTQGAVYFANLDIAEHHPNPKATRTVKIGDHTFFK